jgi:hypothetical protein
MLAVEGLAIAFVNRERICETRMQRQEDVTRNGPG